MICEFLIQWGNSTQKKLSILFEEENCPTPAYLNFLQFPVRRIFIVTLKPHTFLLYVKFFVTSLNAPIKTAPRVIPNLIDTRNPTMLKLHNIQQVYYAPPFGFSHNDDPFSLVQCSGIIHVLFIKVEHHSVKINLHSTC